MGTPVIPPYEKNCITLQEPHTGHRWRTTTGETALREPLGKPRWGHPWRNAVRALDVTSCEPHVGPSWDPHVGHHWEK